MSGGLAQCVGWSGRRCLPLHFALRVTIERRDFQYYSILSPKTSR